MLRNTPTLVGLFAAAVLAGCTSRPAADAIVIGHVAPLSGADKPLGEQARNGIQLAVKEANAGDSRVLGRPVEVLHADSRSEPDAVQPAATRLLTVNRVVALLGGTTTAQAEPLARAAQPYSQPVVTSSPIAGMSGDQVYSVGIAPAYQGQVLARFAAEELKAKHVAVLTDGRRTNATALVAAFVRELRKGDARADEWTYQDDPDAVAMVGRIKQAVTGVVLVAGRHDDFAKFVAQLRKDGVEAPVLFGGEEEGSAVVQESRDLKRTIYAATAFAADGGTATCRDFIKRYREQFGRAPDVHAVLAYDSARLLFEGLRQAHTTEGARLRKALAGMESFDSLTGPLTFTTEHLARRPVYVVRVQDGTSELAKRYEPDK